MLWEVIRGDLTCPIALPHGVGFMYKRERGNYTSFLIHGSRSEMN